MLYLFIFVGIFTFYYYLKFKYYSYWSNSGVITPSCLFPFGNLGKFFVGQGGLCNMTEEWYNSCKGNIVGLYFLTSPAVLIKDPELVKQVLVKDFNHFMDRGMHTDEKKEPTSGHLFRLNGERWKSVRTKLTPAFTAGKLRMMFSTLTGVADQLKTYLTDDIVDGSEINVEDMATRYTADIIASTIFGIETNSFVNKCNDFILHAKTLFLSVSYLRIAKAAMQLFVPKLPRLFNLRTVNPKQTNFIYNVVSDVVNYREENKVARSDLMQLLIQLKNKGEINDQDTVDDLSVFDKVKTQEIGFTLNEVVAQAYTMYFAGYETSASTMGYLLYECALNPKLQATIQSDIDETLDKYNGEISYESIMDMKYLDKAISETLRKYPILPYLNRVVTKSYKIPNTDIILKQGMRVLISVSGLQHDPQYYPDPQKFDPDRFDPENVANRHPLTYIPFGEGPRICIGKRMGRMMVAVGVAILLRNFNVGVCSTTDVPLKFNNWAIFTQTLHPISLKISRRKLSA